MPRQAIQDSVDVAVDAVADLTALLNDARLANGTRVWLTTAGVTQGLWILNQLSTAVVDNLTVVATLSGVGRWIFFGAGSGGGGATNIAVNTEAQSFSAVGVSVLKDGAQAWVGNPLGGAGQSQDSLWTLQTQVGGAPALAAHLVIASAIAGRVWIRQVATSNQRWLQQAEWHVDPANGAASDENSGLAGAPLLTFQEYVRRVGVSPTVSGLVQVFVDSDTPVGDDFVISPMVMPNGFWFLRGGLVQTGAGTLTAARARNTATNTPVGVTDAGQVWAAHLDEIFLDTTAGPNLNAMAWVVKDEGANVGRLTSVVGVNTGAQFLQLSTTEITPGNTDTYTLNRLRRVQGNVSITPTGPFAFEASKARVVIDQIHFDPSATGRTPFIVVLANGPQMAMTTCRFGRTPLFGAGGLLLNLVNCYSSAINWNPNSNSRGNAVAGGMRNAAFFAEGNWALSVGFLIQGDSTSGSINCTFASILGITDAAVFDWGTNILGAVVVDQGATVIITKLWGVSAVANSFVFRIIRGAVEYNNTAATALPIAGALATYAINGRTTGPAVDFAAGPPVVFTNNRAYTAALLDTTVAGGGFGGGILEHSSGCSIHQRL